MWNPKKRRQQWVFHIMVSGHYSEWRETQTIVPIDQPDQDKPATEVALDSGTK